MKDSTKRSIRTLFQGLIGLLAAVPLLATFLPTSDTRLVTIGVSVVAAAAVVSKIVNALEENNLLPSWLKPNPVVATANDGSGDAGNTDLGAIFVVLGCIFTALAIMAMALGDVIPAMVVLALLAILCFGVAHRLDHPRQHRAVASS